MERQSVAPAPVPHEGHWPRVRISLPPSMNRDLQHAADRASMRPDGWIRRAIQRALDAEAR